MREVGSGKKEDLETKTYEDDKLNAGINEKQVRRIHVLNKLDKQTNTQAIMMKKTITVYYKAQLL